MKCSVIEDILFYKLGHGSFKDVEERHEHFVCMGTNWSFTVVCANEALFSGREAIFKSSFWTEFHRILAKFPLIFLSSEAEVTDWLNG